MYIVLIKAHIMSKAKSTCRSILERARTSSQQSSSQDLYSKDDADSEHDTDNYSEAINQPGHA